MSLPASHGHSDLDALEARLGFAFRDRSLLEQALTHRSYRPRADDGPASNERLEFLGDAGLNASLAVQLYTAHPLWTHTELDAVRAAVVSQVTLCRVGRALGLGRFLRLGKGEAQSGCRCRCSLLANAVEAILGAAFVETIATNRCRYLAHDTVRRIVEPLLRAAVGENPDLGYHRLLRELAAHVDTPLPRFQPAPGVGAEGDLVSLAETRIGARFHDRALLRLALTHASHSAADNARLAFVGNAFLNSTVATHLYFICPDGTEGDLTRLRMLAVSEAAVSRVAGRLGLGDVLLLGRGEQRNGGRMRPSILAAALKAIWAAACFDAIEVDPQRIAFRTFMLRILGPWLRAVERDPRRRDHKTILQDLAQKTLGVTPSYRVVRESGPAHHRTFLVEVLAGRRVVGIGRGRAKKRAQQAAARRALADWAAEPRRSRRPPVALRSSLAAQHERTAPP